MWSIGWFGGAVGGLLVTGLGLELLAHQMFGPTDVATLLLALYLAFWFSVIGIAGFILLSVAWLVGRRPRAGRMAESAGDEYPGPEMMSVPLRESAAECEPTDRRHDFNHVA